MNNCLINRCTQCLYTRCNEVKYTGRNILSIYAIVYTMQYTLSNMHIINSTNHYRIYY